MEYHFPPPSPLRPTSISHFELLPTHSGALRFNFDMDRLGRFGPEDDVLSYLDFSDERPRALSPPRDAAAPRDWRVDYLDSMIQGLPESGGAGEGSSKSAASNVADPVFIRFEPGQLDCTRCCLLRELIHSNGYQNVKVTVHGGTNYFTHAIFEIELQDGGRQISTPREFYFINLRTQNGEWVGGFLNMYIVFLDADDSIVLKDTVHPLYTQLCGKPKQEAPHCGLVSSWLQSPQPPSELGSDDEYVGSTSQSTEAADSPGSRKAKTGLALQRERAHNITLKDLADYFHLPIMDAAKNLQLCSTAIKHACRRHGVARWPCRKIKSINRQIDALEAQLLECPRGMLMQEKRNEIERLKARKERLYAGLDCV